MEIYNGFQPEKLLFLQWNWRPTANQYAEVSSYLHGRGVHADWPDNIGPLRMALAQSGWHTLSLQMPVLEKSAKYFDYLASLPEAFPRIEAGIKHLLNNGYRPIVLLAHSCGAYMVMARLETSAGKPIDAFIGIGMGATDYRQPMQRPFPFATLKIPVLDIYGADHDFTAYTGAMAQRISAWQDSLTF
jgi:hypothetical protein